MRKIKYGNFCKSVTGIASGRKHYTTPITVVLIIAKVFAVVIIIPLPVTVFGVLGVQQSCHGEQQGQQEGFQGSPPPPVFLKIKTFISKMF